MCVSYVCVSFISLFSARFFFSTSFYFDVVYGSTPLALIFINCHRCLYTILYSICFRLVQFGLFCGFCAMEVMHGMEKKIQCAYLYIFTTLICRHRTKSLILLNEKSHQRHQQRKKNHTKHTHINDVSISNQKKKNVAYVSLKLTDLLLKSKRPIHCYMGRSFFFLYYVTKAEKNCVRYFFVLCCVVWRNALY